MNIKKKPDFISPNNSPLVYDVLSSNSGLTNFRYDFRLRIDNTEVMSRKLFPYLDGGAKIDISDTLSNYLNSDINHNITSPSEIENRLLLYEMRLGYISSDDTFYPESLGESYIINAVDDNFDYTDFMMNGDGRFLTNSPKTIGIYKDDYYNLDFIIGEYTGITSHVDEITIDVEVLLNAKINIDTNILQFINSYPYDGSDSQSYIINGTELIDDIYIETPEGFQVSLDNTTWVNGITLTQSNFEVSDTIIYVRFIGDVKHQKYESYISHKTLNEFQSKVINKQLNVNGIVELLNSSIHIDSSMVKFEQFGSLIPVIQSYKINAYELVDDIVVTSPDYFEISFNQINWYKSLVITPINIEIINKQIYVKYIGTDTGVVNSGSIVHSTYNEILERYITTNLNVSGEYFVDDYPRITTNLNNLSFVNYYGLDPDIKSYTISAVNLTNNLEISSPINYKISTDQTNWNDYLQITHSDGIIDTTTIYVVLTGDTTGVTYKGDISNYTYYDSELISKNIGLSGYNVVGAYIHIDENLTQFINYLSFDVLSQSYKVSAHNIIDSLDIESPPNYLISLDNINWVTGITLNSVNYTIEETTIYVKLIGTTPNVEYIGDIVHKSNNSGIEYSENLSLLGFYIINEDAFIMKIYKHIYGNHEDDTTWLGFDFDPEGNRLIDWGDGSPLTSDKYHTYESSGFYIVSIIGDIVRIRKSGSYDKIRIINWGSSIFSSISFSGEGGLESIPDEPIPFDSSVTEVTGIFAGCGKLKKVSADIFNNLINVTNLSSCFNRCKRLEYIPEDIFKYNTKLVRVDHCFSSCEKLTYIPSGLFKNNLLLKNIAFSFRITNIEIIPNGLFDNNPFLEYVSNAFQSCSKLETIPNGLFDYNNRLINVAYLFDNCVSITHFPYKLFDNCPLIESFYYAFYNCLSMTGYVPKLWMIYTEVSKSDGCFRNCTKLTNYGSIPSDWK